MSNQSEVIGQQITGWADVGYSGLHWSRVRSTAPFEGMPRFGDDFLVTPHALFQSRERERVVAGLKNLVEGYEAHASTLGPIGRMNTGVSFELGLLKEDANEFRKLTEKLGKSWRRLNLSKVGWSHLEKIFSEISRLSDGLISLAQLDFFHSVNTGAPLGSVYFDPQLRILLGGAGMIEPKSGQKDVVHYLLARAAVGDRFLGLTHRIQNEGLAGDLPQKITTILTSCKDDHKKLAAIIPGFPHNPARRAGAIDIRTGKRLVGNALQTLQGGSGTLPLMDRHAVLPAVYQHSQGSRVARFALSVSRPRTGRLTFAAASHALSGVGVLGCLVFIGIVGNEFLS